MGALMKRTGPTNIHLRLLIKKLKQASRVYDAPVWRTVAHHLSKPRRKRVHVNLSRINRYAAEGDIVVVPGKVLGSGELAKRVTVAAWRFSRSALAKLSSVGEALTIEELLQRNPEGKKVKIIT